MLFIQMYVWSSTNTAALSIEGRHRNSVQRNSAVQLKAQYVKVFSEASLTAYFIFKLKIYIHFAPLREISVFLLVFFVVVVFFWELSLHSVLRNVKRFFTFSKRSVAVK